MKQSGLGQRFFVAGVDLSGDTGSLGSVSGGPAAGDFTGIDKAAYERLGLLRTGHLEWSSWFNPTGAHPVLSALPTTDVYGTYATGTTQGDPAASMIFKQIDYGPQRGADGSLACAVAAESNGFGIEWGQQLTAGLRTDTTATSPATGLDTTASASFGGQAYLQVTAFTGTSVVVSVQDSADNSTFAAVAGFAFTSVTAAPAYERLQLGATATLRRYLRVITVGTFSNLVFHVNVVKNQTTTAF